MALLVHSAGATPVTVNTTDWVLGFRATGGTGSGLDLEVDLGLAPNFYNAAPGTSFTLPGLLVADLISTYGSTWNTRSDLFFGVIATTSTAAVGTKPARTLWASKPWEDPNLTRGTSQTTPWTSPASTFAANNPVNKVNAMLSVGSSGPGALNGQEATTVGGTAAVIDATLANSYRSSDLASAGTSFGFFNPTIDQDTNIPLGGFVGLDMYELQVGAGAGTYLGSISISDAGVATFTAAIPEPSTYVMFGLGTLAMFAAPRLRKRKSDQSQPAPGN